MCTARLFSHGGSDLFALKFYLERVIPHQSKLETLGYPTMKTVSLCVPWFWHSIGVWHTDGFAIVYTARHTVKSPASSCAVCVMPGKFLLKCESCCLNCAPRRLLRHTGKHTEAAYYIVDCCVYCRSEQSTEWTAQAADEGSLCWVMSHCSREAKLSAAVSANANGSTRLCS